MAKKFKTSEDNSTSIAEAITTKITKNDVIALPFLSLLVLQLAIQPTLTKRYISRTCITSTCRTSIIIAQETIKFVIAFVMLLRSGEFSSATDGWNVRGWFVGAWIPSILYVVQNYAALLALQNLDPMTYNVLYQTKILSAALWCYLLMGKKQSRVQIFSLILLLVAALVIEGVITKEGITSIFHSFLNAVVTTEDDNKDGGSFSVTSSWWSTLSSRFDLGKSVTMTRRATHGVAPVLLVSLLSGLSGALSQRSLQWSNVIHRNGSHHATTTKGRNSYLFSMELCSASLIVLCVSVMYGQNGGNDSYQRQGSLATLRLFFSDFFDQWHWTTLLPIILNSFGGILVGLVTKHAGAVRKNFAFVIGFFAAGVVQAVIGAGKGENNDDDENAITMEQIIGGSLAGISLLMHTLYPPHSHGVQSTPQTLKKKVN